MQPKQIKQKFKPAFKVFTGGEELLVKRRVWDCYYSSDKKLQNIKHAHWEIVCENDPNATIPAMPEMGSYQIEEIWKYYKKTIWVSNYGYVADISDKEAEESFGKTRLEELKQGFAFRTCNLPGEAGLYKVKDLFRLRNFVPSNNAGSSMEINLHVTELNENLYTMVADTFIVKPADYDNGYSVHHIDNNSYNNSVTNLIYIEDAVHSQSRLLHPMSHTSSNDLYQTFDAAGNRKELQKIKNN